MFRSEEAVHSRVRSKTLEWVEVMERDWQVDRLMVASDLVVTKANRNTVVELGYLGIPSISLASRLNPMDERSIANISTNRSLEAGALRPESLADCILRVLDGEVARSDDGSLAFRRQSAAVAAAKVIHRRLQSALGNKL